MENRKEIEAQIATLQAKLKTMDAAEEKANGGETAQKDPSSFGDRIEEFLRGKAPGPENKGLTDEELAANDKAPDPENKGLTDEELADNMEPAEEDLASQFEVTHGSPFDPNSSVDKKKMESIKAKLSDPATKGKTPEQIAIEIYREDN